MSPGSLRTQSFIDDDHRPLRLIIARQTMVFALDDISNSSSSDSGQKMEWQEWKLILMMILVSLQ